MSKDLMIDFETLGTGPDTIVISLGACFFDLETGLIGPTFYMAFDIADQQAAGRVFTPDTLKWWMGQSGAAKKVFNEKAKPTLEVLQTFAAWVQGQGTVSKITPWGNGATFDISIIESLFKQFNVKCPWLYYNVMDMRTFRRFVAGNAKVDKAEGTNHNALDDSLNQAKFCIDHYKFFKEMIQTYKDLAKGAESDSTQG